MFHSIQYKNGWLAASGLFDMCTQSIKFDTLYYQYRCLTVKMDGCSFQQVLQQNLG